VFQLVRYQVDPLKPVLWVALKSFFSAHTVYILYVGDMVYVQMRTCKCKTYFLKQNSISIAMKCLRI
jgi:hypothetical protein